jgi:aldehyde dehydrogenase (NAD+)
VTFFAGAADAVKWTETRNGCYGQTIVSREPVGAVGAIVAWNVPLFLAVDKLGPALLAGCTVVLKPAAETPLTANALAQVFAEPGLPEGVLSVVPGWCAAVAARKDWTPNTSCSPPCSPTWTTR